MTNILISTLFKHKHKHKHLLYLQVGQPFVNSAVQSFSEASGWYLWNWKVERGLGFDSWDVQYQHEIGGLDPLQLYDE